jgi:hypothetical protein
MKNHCNAVLLFFVLLALVPHLNSQATRKSHEQCLKLVPGDWGPNFGAQWHENEARYWACRLGRTPETVRALQKTAEVEGFMQDIVVASPDGISIVVIEEIQGTANCHIFSALSNTSGNWRRVWDGPERLPSDYEGKYCTGLAGAIRVLVRSDVLTLDIPDCTDTDVQPGASCKHVTWTKESYRWNGKTFVRSK